MACLATSAFLVSMEIMHVLPAARIALLKFGTIQIVKNVGDIDIMWKQPVTNSTMFVPDDGYNPAQLLLHRDRAGAGPGGLAPDVDDAGALRLHALRLLHRCADLLAVSPAVTKAVDTKRT